MNALPALIGGALLIVGAWLLLAALLAGIGLLFRRLWRRSEPVDLDESFTLIWVGYALVLLVLQTVHFFRPIDSWSVAIIGAGGAAGIALHAARLRHELTARVFRSGNRIPILVAALFLIWAANRSAGPLTFYDSGMYHVPAVEWFKEYPVVPGLGNLHGRLAFNSSSLLFAALLDRGPFSSGANHLVNGVVLVLLAVEVLRRWTRLVRGDRSRIRSDLIAIVLLPAIVMMFVREDARSLSTDVAVTVLLMVVGLRLFDVLQYAALVRQQKVYDVAVLALLAAAAVSVKLTAAPFAVGAVALAVYASSRPAPDALELKHLMRVAVVPGLLMGTWLVRGVTLSGYPMYPVRFLAAPVEWRVPAEQAAAEAAWVQMSARYLNTNEIGVGFDWLPRWVSGVLTRGDLFVHVTVPVIILLAVALHGLVWRRRVGATETAVPDETHANWVALLVGGLLGATAVVWFVSAPHTRFGQSTFWLAAGLAVSSRLSPWIYSDDERSVIARSWLGRGVVALTALLWVGHAAGIVSRSAEPRSWRLAAQEFLTLPDETSWLQPMPEPNLDTFVTESGLALHVPRNDNSCWAGPLLCTPHPAMNLALRRDGQPHHGFVTRGAWSPTRFPNPWTPFLALWRCQQQRAPGAAADHDRLCLDRARQSAPDGAPGR